MSVTLDDVRLARKRAYDRVDYWLQKYQGVTIHEAGISIPRIPKDLHPSEYGEWFDYFESFTGAQEEGGTKDYLEGEYEPPDLDPEYHPEPEPPEEPDLPEEPEPPEPSEEPDFSDEPWWEDYEEDEAPEPEPPEPEPEEDEWSNDDWWEYGDYEDADTAPNYFESVDEIINRGYEYGSKIGEALEEAMNNIMNVLGVDDEEEFAKSLGNMDDVFSEFEKAKEYLSKLQEEDSNNTSSKLFKSGIDHLNRGLSQLYKKVGLLYTRGL